MKKRNDYKVRPNTQSQRTQEGLYDVVCGGELQVTVQGERNAQAYADKLNADPWYNDRGQTRMERGGAPNYGYIGGDQGFFN